MLTADELAILRKPEVQEYIREKWNGKVRFCEQYLFQGFINHCLCQEGRKITPNMILIPDCISRDSKRPERGLWGMIDWSEKAAIRVEFHNIPDGQVYLILWSESTDSEDMKESHFVCTPHLALLKALEWQIERGKG